MALKNQQSDHNTFWETPVSDIKHTPVWKKYFCLHMVLLLYTIQIKIFFKIYKNKLLIYKYISHTKIFQVIWWQMKMKLNKK